MGSGGRVGPWDHRRPGVPKLQGGESGTCHREPAGPAQRSGPPPSEQFGDAAVGDDGASAGGQAQGQSAQGAPGQPHRAGQELGQAPQAFHGAGARRRELRDPSPSCRTVAGRPALSDPAPAPKLRRRHTEHAPVRRACVPHLRLISRACSEGASACASRDARPIRALPSAPVCVLVKSVWTGPGVGRGRVPG